MKNHVAFIGLALAFSALACSENRPLIPEQSHVSTENDPAPTNSDADDPFPVGLGDEQSLTDMNYDDIGQRINSVAKDGAIITEGQIRPRRRHENDMDFSKFNPFYWEGRQAKFKVEDYTASGQKKIRFTMTTEWPQNYIPTRGPDFSAIYSGNPVAAAETERSKFKINMRMKHVGDFRVFEATLDEGVFNAYANSMKKGEMLTFEFRFFMDESFPDWQKQKQANFHNLSAYYSEFFRIRIGEPGLFLDNPIDPKILPSPLRSSGGWTTIPTVRVEPWKALQQQALNLTEDNAQNFMTGRTWFHTDFTTGEHVRDPSDDKPTIFFKEMKEERAGYAANSFNVKSCNTCHENNGIALLPAVGKTVATTVAKTFDKTKGTVHPAFGAQLQVAGEKDEGQLKLESYSEKVVKLADGTTVTLKKPVFKVESGLDQKNLGLSLRRPQAMIGMGLLEAVPADSIKQIAASNGGKYEMVDGKIGRYGWKADKNSLKHQIGAALKHDLGVLSQNFVEVDCGNSCEEGRGQLSNEAIDKMESYIALLGVPPRLDPTSETVRKGEKIFDALSCQSCHVKSLKTGDSDFPELANQTIQPFTDLLLHDMGEDLKDDSGAANAKLWRTAPLWGLKNVKHSTDDHLKEFA